MFRIFLFGVGEGRLYTDTAFQILIGRVRVRSKAFKVFFFFLPAENMVIQGQVCHFEGMQIKWPCYCEELCLFYYIAVLIHPRSCQPSIYPIF